MSDIYRNAGRTLAWIGEAPAKLAKETFQLIDEFALITQRLGLASFAFDTSTRIRPPQTLEIGPNYFLEDLLKDDIWVTLVDIFAKRRYFSRLWTLQEIALSSLEKTIVYCGTYSVSWKTFRDAALLIDHSGILVHDLEVQGRIDGLFNVTCQAQAQALVRDEAATVLSCLRATYTRNVSESRDRIFGFIGMLDTETRSELQELSYSTSPGQIFQKVTEMVIGVLPKFSYLFFHSFVSESLEELDTPSWVLWMDNNPLRIVPGDMPRFKIEGTKGITIAGSTIQAFGFVLDIVTGATDNLSAENIEKQVLGCYDDWIRASADGKDHASSIELLWQLFTLLNKAPTEDQLCEFATWVARLKIWSGAYTIDEVTAIANASRIGKPPFNDLEITDFIKETSTDDDDFEQPRFEGILCRSKTSHGRNFFSTRLGYCGVGPAGDSSPGNNSPVVQVGDLVTILATGPAPIILRKIDEEYYKLVGLAHIPHITTDPEFKKGLAEGHAGKFQTFSIR